MKRTLQKPWVMYSHAFIRQCPSCPFTELLERYFSWLAITFTRQTARNRLYYVHRFLHSSSAPENPAKVIEFLNTTGTSPSTRKNALDALRNFARWRGIVGEPAWEGLSLIPSPRVARGMPRPAPGHVVASGVRMAPRDQDRLMILLGVLAGLRSGEISRVHTRDILGDQLRVTGKGGHVRHVPLRPELVAALELAPRGWVFPSEKNPSGHMLAASISQRLGDLLGRGWSGHTLRHKFATEVYAGTLDIIALRDLLGHRNVDTTMVYTRVSSTKLREAVESMDTRFLQT